MSIKEILNITNHRPWKIPRGSWKFYQEWNNAVFLHWQVELAELKKIVTQELEIDLFDGKPWVSIVVFNMEKIRLKNFPSFPPISDFDEINIRTYVKSNNKTGVYFLSIEGGTSLSCKLAKLISKLPYRYSRMERDEGVFKSTNSVYNENFKLSYNTGEIVSEKEELDLWLTERYALFLETTNSINEFEIHHLEWPINTIKIKKLELNYPRFNQLINNVPHKVQFSKGVKVVAWGKKKLIKLN